MEKNKEQILKYLSELMTENEKRIFENELNVNSNLKNDYEKFINLIKVDKSLTNEKYFTNLLPKVKIKLEEEKKYYHKKLAYGIPSLIVTIVLVVLLINTNLKNNSIEFDDKLNDPQIFSEYISEVDDESKEKYFDIISSQDITNIEIQNEDEKNKLISIYDSILDDERIYLALNDSEYNKLINEIKNKN